MKDYKSKLTPDLVNLDTEGGLDTSLINNISIQRTINVLDVVKEDGTRKQISTLKDGEVFNDKIFGVPEPTPNILSSRVKIVW